MLKRITFLLAFFSVFSQHIHAQCAMCKAVVETNEEEFGSSINTGIIFMILVVYTILILLFRKRIVKIFKELKNVYD